MAASVPFTLVNRMGSLYLEVAADDILPRAMYFLAWDVQSHTSATTGSWPALPLQLQRLGDCQSGQPLKRSFGPCSFKTTGINAAQWRDHLLHDPCAHGAGMDEDSFGAGRHGAWLASAHG